ncbi:SEL1-like repeat protein [Magnetospira sp. QH-2]|uniref:SEL1-like repeat protein n=1 Tax=Magnetospira sp. (strain QH-2) TaxID=1288970 RepID=UPI0003E81786|nr:SEL1-like repeat protein [Magnetospira sp. QH-2]CCQ72017.1 exported protein of unknown function [Magnetospira sp. QH-2]
MIDFMQITRRSVFWAFLLLGSVASFAAARAQPPEKNQDPSPVTVGLEPETPPCQDRAGSTSGAPDLITFIREVYDEAVTLIRGNACRAPDPLQAARWAMILDLKLHHRNGALMLGYLYRKGLGVERDDTEADYWFRRYALVWLREPDRSLEYIRTMARITLLGFGELESEHIEALDKHLVWVAGLKDLDGKALFDLSHELRTGEGEILDPESADRVLTLASFKSFLPATIEKAKRILERRQNLSFDLRNEQYDDLSHYLFMISAETKSTWALANWAGFKFQVQHRLIWRMPRLA